MTLEDNPKSKCTIEDLPDEVLEFILSLIPPYKDLHDCLMVSKRWRRCVLSMCFPLNHASKINPGKEFLCLRLQYHTN